MIKGRKKERESSQFDPVFEGRKRSERGQRSNFTGCCSCPFSPNVVTAKVSDSDRKKERGRGVKGREERIKQTQGKTHKHILIETDKGRHKTRERKSVWEKEEKIHPYERQTKKEGQQVGFT